MIRDDIRRLQFDEGIYEIDTRSFRIDRCEEIPERLFILDSDPLTRVELLEFLSIVKDKSRGFTSDWGSTDIARGFWPLKYIYVVAGENKYYILSRYFKKIDWKKILTG